MLRQEMSPATVAVPALSAVKHNLRLSHRRLRHLAPNRRGIIPIRVERRIKIDQIHTPVIHPRITSRLSPSKIVHLGMLHTPCSAVAVVITSSVRPERYHPKDGGKRPLRALSEPGLKGFEGLKDGRG